MGADTAEDKELAGTVEDTAEDTESAGKEEEAAGREDKGEELADKGEAAAGEVGTWSKRIRAICYHNRGHTSDE